MPSSATCGNTLYLPIDQAKKALFPPSCLVLYNPNLHSAHNKHESILSRVTSICIELGQLSVAVTNRLYNLTIENEPGTIPLVPEHALFFAPGCPVYCSTRESFQGTCEDDWMEGIVLESKDGKYLVSFRGREWYFPRIRVKYRSFDKIPINLILPPEQAEMALFPPSCPVRCSDRRAQDNPRITYYVKCVKEISFNNFYDLSVIYKAKIFNLKDISQDNLRFAPDCPVYISKNENFEGILEKDYLEGDVLKLNDNGEYLVSFCGMECSFPQSRLKYRSGINTVSEQIDQIGILRNHEVGNRDQTKDGVDNRRIKENDALPIIATEYINHHASTAAGNVAIPKEILPNAEEISGGDEEAKEHSGKRKSLCVGDTTKENVYSSVSTDSLSSSDSSCNETKTREKEISRKRPKQFQGAMFNNPKPASDPGISSDINQELVESPSMTDSLPNYRKSNNSIDDSSMSLEKHGKGGDQDSHISNTSSSNMVNAPTSAAKIGDKYADHSATAKSPVTDMEYKRSDSIMNHSGNVNNDSMKKGLPTTSSVLVVPGFLNNNGYGQDIEQGKKIAVKEEESLIDHWMLCFEDLKQFKNRKGHFDVPYSYEENPALGKWVCIQRSDYKRSRIGQDQRELLDGINFTWEIQKIGYDANWMQSFKALEQFKAQKGHFDVPYSSPKHFQLGRWVWNQRSEYSRSVLGKGRLDLLNGIGFSWRSPQRKGFDEKWMEHFEALKKFKAEEGHFNVSRAKKPQLAQWVTRQKSFYKTGNISELRVKALQEIGLTDHSGKEIRVSLMRHKNMSKPSPPK